MSPYAPPSDYTFPIAIPDAEKHGIPDSGMMVYLKADDDGVSVGACPFAQGVRLTLEEKGVKYTPKPSTADTKPTWLVDHYQGKMPALQNGNECYVESNVIGDYIEATFPEPTLKSTSAEAEALLAGFIFPTVGNYIKDKDDTAEPLQALKAKLDAMEAHLKDKEWLCGDSITVMDCRMLPQLYHLKCAAEAFKEGKPLTSEAYPVITKYMEKGFALPSWKATVYPPEYVVSTWAGMRG
mmetsp:Transcript_13630/g.24435  ORF Transcript_13630/g.24435 Transcript_13630/m.24435 type:complete len:239 (-) Transcript_13630:96-812(-)